MTDRVLIYRLGSLGDTVVALPSLHLIARISDGGAVRTNKYSGKCKSTGDGGGSRSQ